MDHHTAGLTLKKWLNFDVDADSDVDCRLLVISRTIVE